jgi:chemotaxis protein methyltransferase CheR
LSLAKGNELLNYESDNKALPLSGDDLPEAAFEAILDQLRLRRQFNLGAYKDRCVRRRIAKRLRSSGVPDVAGYLALLADGDGELDALAAALSIHVSQFFRNPGVFAVLERQILPALFRLASASGRHELRLWSVGCAGGEEAYSLALLIDEQIPAGFKIDILATDVSEPVLESARAALYEPARLTEVPPPVLARYFTAEGECFRLIERVRAMVRFECHDVMAAAEFPAADLILCRNLLIYFTREEQVRILTRFAAALPEGGALVLGSAETLTGVERLLFRTEFPAERIYRRTATPVSEAQVEAR